MKVFISADIEGTAFTTYWEETEKDKGTYARAAEEMTREECMGAELVVLGDAGKRRADPRLVGQPDGHGRRRRRKL